MSKDTPQPPAQPDYVGTARSQAIASNPNVNNPLGSQQVTWAGDQPTINQTLSPAQQQLLENYQRNQGMASNAANYQLLGVGGQFNPQLNAMRSELSPLPYSGAPTGQQTSFGGYGDVQTGVQGGGPIQRNVAGPDQFAAQGLQAQNAIMARQQPLLDRTRRMQETQLANQGIARGSEAYAADESQLARNETDAQQQAILAGNQLQQNLFGMGLQSGQFANNAQGQQFGQNLQQGNFANQAQQQQYNQGLGSASFANQALQNQFGQNQAANQQNLGYQTAGAQLANQANQQGFNQQQAQYQLPFNLYNSLQQGSQVNMPQFQGFQAPNYLNAAQMQGQAANNAYSAQVGAQNAQTQGLFGLGGAGLQAFGMSQMSPYGLLGMGVG
jgi:hypothetical protein